MMDAGEIVCPPGMLVPDVTNPNSGLQPRGISAKVTVVPFERPRPWPQKKKKKKGGRSIFQQFDCCNLMAGKITDIGFISI